MDPEILCREAYHRYFAAECELAREMLWGNGAVAIQLWHGLTTTRVAWQGSYLIDGSSIWCKRGSSRAISEWGVLGAMDTMYQRGKIQKELMYYEHKKHDGSWPLIALLLGAP